MTAISTIAPTEALAEIEALRTAPATPDLFGHPRGLAVLFGTKLWDGISFYGMQALLTLYMAQQLLLPGHVENVAGFVAFRHAIEAITGPLSPDALASQIFGLYVGAAYFTPIFGGAVADRWLGLRNSIALGALLMTAGHFCMAYDASFLLALALLIIGAGLMHPNVMAQVGRLYDIDDRRRADGFQIYYLAVNLSAFMAPILTGLLAQIYGWHVGFGFAGVGMLGGLIVYLWGARHLPPDPPRRRAANTAPAAPLTPGERQRVLLLIALVPVFSLFWMAQSQVWNVYNLWVRDHVDMVVAGWTMPIPWLQAIDGLSPALLLPLGVGLWRAQAARGTEPDDFGKMAIGCLIFAGGTLWLASATLVFPGRVPVLWAVGFHLFSNAGWLFFVPICVAFYARVAPLRLNAMMVGACSLSTFVGSVASGSIGGLYGSLSPPAFWGLHAAIVGGGGVILLAIAPGLRRFLDRALHAPAA